nr:Ig-like domain-containing protein [Calothrix sp. MO_167.B12]
LTFLGTAEANSTVEVFIDGSSVGTTTANGSGNWSFDHTQTTLNDGTYAITAKATDAAGNSNTSNAFNITVDTSIITPTITSISDDTNTTNDGITSDNTLTFLGTAEANSTVKVFIDGSSVGTTTADGSGNWSFDHTQTTLNDGTYPITAKATDAAGNSNTSTAFNITVDTTAPTTPTVNTLTTGDNTPTLTGTATVTTGETLTVKVNDVTYTDGDGNLSLSGNNWSLTIPDSNTLAVNTYEVTATVTDKAGNNSDTAAATLTVKADTDNDGISDDTEISAGDANQDGTPDSQQTNVASTETITIVSTPGTTISDVQITTNTSSSDPENQGITLPLGLLDFTLAGLTPGASTIVSLLLTQNQDYNTFWKYGKTPDNDQERWYEFLYDGETGAQFFDTDNDGKTDQILLHFVDGKRGDADLTANGIIVDPGTPGVTNTDLSLSKSTTEDIWSVEGDVGAAVAKFSLVDKNSTQVNEVGLFKVDANNQVNGIAAGETGFAQAVLQQGEVIFSTLGDELLNGVDLTRHLQVGAGERLAFYFISDGTADTALNTNNFDNVFFSINEGNANSQDYLQVSESGSIYTLNWEQGNDNSFNDLVINFQLENTPLTTQSLIGNYQGEEEGELINLQSFTGRQVQATFTLHREADYDNFVSFYKVDDTEGTITDELTGDKLKPGDAGYAELVVKQRISGIELSVDNNQSVTVEDTLSGGSFFAPFMIADANPDNLNGDFSKVYTPYIMGNSDQADHIRLLGDNTFGFEDLAVGGDNDFNDLIVSASFQVV